MRVRWLSGMGLLACPLAWLANAAETVDRPFRGVTHIVRTETVPRALRIHILKIDLTAPGIAFKLTSPGGARETGRQTTLDFLKQERAQIAVNAHFFWPFPSGETDASLIGFAASGGSVYSGCEKPTQSYAIVAYAPALNIDSANRAAIVHCDPSDETGRRLREKIAIGNAVAGSAQIITDGVKTVPTYGAEGLTPGGPNNYSSANSWYDAVNARTVIGLSRDNRTLFFLIVDARGGSAGLRVAEAADLLIQDYGVYNALNLDGGGSTTLAMENPKTHERSIVNVPSGDPGGRSVGSNLAIFAVQ
jgi:exopolysaccharide biosynthesis protein